MRRDQTMAFLLVLEAFVHQAWNASEPGEVLNVNWEGFFLAWRCFQAAGWPNSSRAIKEQAGAWSRMASRFVDSAYNWEPESSFHALGAWSLKHYALDMRLFMQGVDKNKKRPGLPYHDTVYVHLQRHDLPPDVSNTAIFLLLITMLYDDGSTSFPIPTWAEAALYIARLCHGGRDLHPNLSQETLRLVEMMLQAIEHGARPTILTHAFPRLAQRPWDAWRDLMDPPSAPLAPTRKRKRIQLEEEA